MTIQPVKTRSDLKDFIAFQRQLYFGNDCYVPPLDKAEMAFFSPDNPMANDCDVVLWVMKEGDYVFGRIAAIINHRFNKDKGILQARFTHFDCIDNREVAFSLFEAAEKWAKDKGMTEIIGPFGYTNLDKHGLLIEGFDELACQSSNYNHPYYEIYVESYGFEKLHDWVESQFEIPEEEPERIKQFSQTIKERNNLRIHSFKNKEELIEFAPRLFELYNTTYANLYGVNKLEQEQIEHLAHEFIPFLNPDLVTVIANEKGDPVAFGITMFSLSKSLQKANGRLFPLGFFYLLFNRRKNPLLDLLLIGIHPEYQRKGVNALVFQEIYKGIRKHNLRQVETTQTLESNHAVLNLWSAYNSRVHKRSRLYRKSIH